MTNAVRERREGRPALALWFGFLGAPAAWALQLLADYAVVSHSCFPRGTPLDAPSVAATRPLAIVIALATLAMALAALWTSVRLWREAEGDQGGWRRDVLASDQARARRFLAFSGILFGTIFAALIVYNGIALAMLPTCAY
ncbi:MAG TPA: hypothetical protein VFS05_10755 [Gemmatimonadaceae bacterium]|nr:hypothetical protein [Gemmatimonadaceae bacterium]